MPDSCAQVLKPKPQQIDFITKLKAAWRIFFPPAPEKLSPKEAGKSRLRMILVADRSVHIPRPHQLLPGSRQSASRCSSLPNPCGSQDPQSAGAV